MPAHKVPHRQCGVPGCATNAATSAGGKGKFCTPHYKRLQRHGDPTAGRVANGKVAAWMEAHKAYEGDDCITCPEGSQRVGYRGFSLNGFATSAQRAMCIMAHGEPPSPDMEAAHSCGNGDRGCLNRNHLSWKTPSGNQADRFVHGTDNAGEKSANARLTSAQVDLIRTNPEGLSAYRLAKMFGVSDTHVRRIQKYEAWAHQ